MGQIRWYRLSALPLPVITVTPRGRWLFSQRLFEDLSQTDMRLRAMAARRRLGQSLGGDGGRELIAQADDWMRSQEIKKSCLADANASPGLV